MGNSVLNSCKNKDPQDQKEGDRDQTLEEQRLEARKRRRAKRKEREAVASAIEDICKFKKSEDTQLNSQASDLTHQPNQVDASLPLLRPVNTLSFQSNILDATSSGLSNNNHHHRSTTDSSNINKTRQYDQNISSSHAQFNENNDLRAKGNNDGYFSTDDIAYYEKKFFNEKKVVPPKNKSIRWKQAEVLGTGSFGQVTLGWNIDTGEMMAVKQIHIGGYNPADRKEKIQQIQSEIEALQTLVNKNIVRYIGVKKSDNSINIFLEHVPGGSISSLLYRYGKFNETLIKQFIKQILKGLEYLHAHEIIHRDIKGANVLVDKDGQCKLADFGSAKKIVEEKGKNDSIRGTPYWMAPETIKQAGSGRFADIWSIGCTVIEMATSKPPLSDKNPIQAMFTIANAVEPPPIPKDLSPECRDFISKCLKISPKERFNVRQLLSHDFLKSKTITPSSTIVERKTSVEVSKNKVDVGNNDYSSNMMAGKIPPKPINEVKQQQIIINKADSPKSQEMQNDGKGGLNFQQLFDEISKISSCIDHSYSEISLQSRRSSSNSNSSCSRKSSSSSLSNEEQPMSKPKNEQPPRDEEGPNLAGKKASRQQHPVDTQSTPIMISSFPQQNHRQAANVGHQSQANMVGSVDSGQRAANNNNNNNHSVIMQQPFDQENLVTDPGFLLASDPEQIPAFDSDSFSVSPAN